MNECQENLQQCLKIYQPSAGAVVIYATTAIFFFCRHDHNTLDITIVSVLVPADVHVCLEVRLWCYRRMRVVMQRFLHEAKEVTYFESFDSWTHARGVFEDVELPR